MRTSTFNYIKDILADFYKTDEYIRQREEELRHPYQEADLNARTRTSLCSDRTNGDYDSYGSSSVELREKSRHYQKLFS